MALARMARFAAILSTRRARCGRAVVAARSTRRWAWRSRRSTPPGSVSAAQAGSWGVPASRQRSTSICVPVHSSRGGACVVDVVDVGGTDVVLGASVEFVVGVVVGTVVGDGVDVVVVPSVATVVVVLDVVVVTGLVELVVVVDRRVVVVVDVVLVVVLGGEMLDVVVVGGVAVMRSTP